MICYSWNSHEILEAIGLYYIDMWNEKEALSNILSGIFIILLFCTIRAIYELLLNEMRTFLRVIVSIFRRHYHSIPCNGLGIKFQKNQCFDYVVNLVKLHSPIEKWFTLLHILKGESPFRRVNGQERWITIYKSEFLHAIFNYGEKGEWPFERANCGGGMARFRKWCYD